MSINRENQPPQAADFKIVKGNKKYEEQMKKLWAECFPEDKDSGFIPFFFANLYQREQTYLAVYEDTLCAMVYAPQMKYRFCGVDFTVPYIQGVATDPKFRRLGLANRLLAAALRDLNLQGAPFGILKPFNVDFYAKSGWRLFASLTKMPLSQVKIPQNYLQKTQPLIAEIKNNKQNIKQYIEDLAAVFEFWQRNSGNAYPLRSHRAWELLLQDHFNDGGRVFGVFYGDKLSAYSLYLEEETAITLRETAYGSQEALYLLLDFLQNFCGKKQKAIMHLPVNSPLLTESNRRQASTEPFAMLRVINCETLLSALDFGIGKEEMLYLQITDEVIKNNNGIFRLEHHPGGSLCQKEQAENTAKAAPNLPRKIDANWLTEALSECYNCYDFKAKKSTNRPAEQRQNFGCAYFNEYF